MAETDRSFRTVLRGYDPAQVNERIGEFEVQSAMARQQVHELTARVRELMNAQAADTAAPTFENLGQRIAQILTLAEEEAAHIRASATNEARERLYDAEQAANQARVEADAYAKLVRSDAETESARITEESQAQLADMEAKREEARAAAEKQRADAEVVARRILEDAQSRADETVAEGKAQADRIRADSDRELAAAMQRRDSINAQLTNVREMLTTLSGSGSVDMMALDPGPDPDAQVDEPVADADAASDEVEPDNEVAAAKKS